MSYGTRDSEEVGNSFLTNNYAEGVGNDEASALLTPDEVNKVRQYQRWSKGLLSVGLCILVGLILGFIGAVCVQFGFQAAIDENIFSSKILLRGSAAHEAWLSSQSTSKHVSAGSSQISAIMLNLKNPEEVLGGAVPLYEELPPVVYDRHFEKFDVFQNADNSTISFKERVHYTPNPTLSKVDPMTTLVTNVNPSYLTLMHQEGGEKKLYSRMVAHTVRNIFHRLTSEYVSIAFHGFRSSLLQSRLENIGGSLDDFCDIWTTGAPTDSDKWRHMTLRIFETDTPVIISLETCKRLWSPDVEYSLVEGRAAALSHASLWVRAADGDANARKELLEKFDLLLPPAFHAITTWLKHFDSQETWFAIKDKIFEDGTPDVQKDLFTYEDLGFYQWGQGHGNPFTRDQTVKDILKLSASPEFYYWAKDLYINVKFDIPTAKRIAALFLREDKVTQFMEMAEQNDYRAIKKDLRISNDEAVALFKYMKFIGESFFVSALKEFGENNKALFSTRTIHEWLVEYDDKLLELTGRKHLSQSLRILKTVEDKDSKTSMISTGTLDLSTASQILLADDVSVLPWSDKKGNRVVVSGSDGSQFQTDLDETVDVLQFWSPETMRTREFTFNDKTSHNGVACLQFKESAAMWEENQIFQNGYAGQSNMTVFGSPLFLGNWRFYGSDPVWRERVSGLKDASEKDISTFDVEPHTGLTFDRKKRYQVNMHIPNNSTWLNLFHPQLEEMEAVLFPITMIEESTSVASSNLQSFKSDLPTTIIFRDILYWCMVALCIFCFAVGGTTTLAGFALKNKAIGISK